MASLPYRVRSACAEVVRRARYVAIDHDSLAREASDLPEPAGVPGLDPAVHYLDGSAEAVSAFVLCLDAINFGSGWWPTVRKLPGRSGSMTMASGLADHFRAHRPWTADELACLDSATVAEVLAQEPSHELMALFTAALRDLGTHVRDDLGGDFSRLINDAEGSAVALVTRLAGWGCFFDVSTYQDLEVPFFKRAQLCAADLQAAGVASFDDLDSLTAFADNLIPHVLALDGVLVLDDKLAERIAAGELLIHDSPEEVELRACALHAIELMAEACERHLTPAQIDTVLWTKGQAPHYKARPRPRARTTAY